MASLKLVRSPISRVSFDSWFQATSPWKWALEKICSCASSWVDTTRNELKKSLARSFLLEDVRKPEVSYHWSKNPLLKGSTLTVLRQENAFNKSCNFCILQITVSVMQMAHDYNKCIGGVYRNAELLDSYCSVRKSTKWTKKVASHLPEKGFLNALTLYKKSGGNSHLWDSS